MAKVGGAFGLQQPLVWAGERERDITKDNIIFIEDVIFYCHLSDPGPVIFNIVIL